MKTLSPPAFRQACDFVKRHARPLEQAQLAHDFEGAPAAPVLAALAAFQNPDGGFGRALEPDLRIPDSSGLATLTALDVLHELGCDSREPLVRGAIGWLVAGFDPAIPGWRCVPANVDDHPHAPHWVWALHAPGGPWDPRLIPSLALWSHLSRWDSLSPAPLRETLAAALLPHARALAGDVGADGLVYASRLEDPQVRARCRSKALEIVSRDPAEWTGYCAKPLKLAPSPASPLADCLAAEVAENLDWELAQQAPDGSWQPNWSWQGQFPADWERARREWQGEVTLRTLRSLRAYDRIEGL
jgi:hypothetical protein